jgi:hypothetical protein
MAGEPDSAAGGRTCNGWVTVEAVEAAIGRSVDDLEVDVWAEREGRIECELLADDAPVLELSSRNWEVAGDRDEVLLRDAAGTVEGPLEDSWIGPRTDEDDGQLLGLARLAQDPADLALTVAVRQPAADGDTVAAVARLLEELAATAVDGSPDTA